MDTKWRRFKSTRRVKIALAVMIIACFAAMGVIWAFVPAFGYLGYPNSGSYLWDSLMADDYYSSKSFAAEVNSDYQWARNTYLSNGDPKESIKNADFYCSIYRYVNAYTKVRRDYYSNDIEADFVYTIGRGKITSEDVSIPDEFYNTIFRYSDPNAPDLYIEIGYTNEHYNQMQAHWYEMRRNTKIVIISDIILLSLGLLLLIWFGRIAGETPDGIVELKKYHSIPYEVYIAFFIIISSCAGVLAVGEGPHCSTINERTLFMAVVGALTAFAAMIVVLLVYTYAVRAQHKKAVRGMFCFRVIGWILSGFKWIFRQLKRFAMFAKEVLTGEIYKGCVTQRVLFIDCGFIAVSCFALILAISALFNSNEFVFIMAIVIEIIAIVLFLYGRHLILRDGALLEQKIKQMHSGIYGEAPTLSKNSPYGVCMQQLSELSDQYQHSVEESVKAERMKLELVTNVSHDLKTPLTSIIGYVELLSKEELTGDAAEYVNILRLKSERLKNIVADVFELAKTTSGEITVAKEQLDLTKLSYQTLGEMEDRIAQSGLTIKTSICDPPVSVISDGKRLYRVIQNILDNALKYSLKGTRVYYTLETKEGRAYITVKNIASYEMTFTKDEIMERFTRGDKSRSTEGTGLGLSIAQGFALACGGEFDIDIDGDMFKATLSLPLANSAVKPAEPVAVSADE